MYYVYIRDEDNSEPTRVIVSDLLASVNYRRRRLTGDGKRYAGLTNAGLTNAGNNGFYLLIDTVARLN